MYHVVVFDLSQPVDPDEAPKAHSQVSYSVSVFFDAVVNQEVPSSVSLRELLVILRNYEVVYHFLSPVIRIVLPSPLLAAEVSHSIFGGSQAAFESLCVHVQNSPMSELAFSDYFES